MMRSGAQAPDTADSSHDVLGRTGLALWVLPVVQLWDALPEPWNRLGVLLMLAALMLGAAIVTRKRRVVHASLVAGLLAVGGFFFLRNQGIVPERPDAADNRILSRAREILPSDSHWDRSPSRTCLPGASRLTLYCALHQASIEVTGGFRHRRPSMQIVRELIEKRRPTANYGHRIAGFNSDPAVSFQDVAELLDAAMAEVKERMTSR